MRRWCLLVSTTALVFVVGCGQKSYSDRMTHNLERLERTRRINKNLMTAVEDKKFKDLAIYIRAPKDEGMAKASLLPEGPFDLESSFLDDKTGATLHLLARVKLPKKPQTKGAAPAPTPAPRGDFTRDVLNTLSGVYGTVDGFATPKFVEESKRGNRFKRLVVTVGDKEIKVYTYKQDNHEVALVFVYNTALKGALSTKIELCLESFAAGAKASKIFNNNGEEEVDDASGATPVPM